MFHAFTTRRLSLSTQKDDQAVAAKPSRPCHVGGAPRTAKKPPLCPKQPARNPECKPRKDAGKEVRLLGSAPKTLLSGTQWQKDYLGFAREVMESGGQDALHLLRKRRRSQGALTGDESAGSREMQDASLSELPTSDQQDQEHVTRQLHGLQVEESPRSKETRNPFRSPKRKPLRRRLSASNIQDLLKDREAGTGSPMLTLGGAIIGTVDEVDVKGLTEILTPEERVAWQTFAPLHRVLIVAIAAAASANLQRQDVQEQGRLQRAVEARDHALALMRQQIGHLLAAPKGRSLFSQQHHTAGNHIPNAPLFAEALDVKPSVEGPLLDDFTLGSVSPSPPMLRCASPLPHRKQTSRQHEDTVGTKRQGGPSDLSASFESVVARAVMSGGKGLRESMESVKGALQSGHKMQASWMHLAKDEKSVSPVRSGGGLSEVEPNLVHLRNSPLKYSAGAGAGQHDMAVKCAAVIAQAKNAAVAVLNREAAAVLAALVVVVRTAAELERGQRTAEVEEGPSSVGTELRLAVEGATARILSLQEAVSATWHSLGPAAQAALQGSTAGKGTFNQRLDSAGIAADGCTTPRQSLRTPGGDLLRASLRASSSSLPSPLQSVEFSKGVLRRSCEGVSLLGRHQGQQVTAMVQTAVNRAVDRAMSQAEEGPGGSNESEAGRELVAELEKAAAKMAGMEAQLAALQKELRASNESKQGLTTELEAVQNQHARTQVCLEQEARDLESELTLRDCAIGELRRSHAVVVAAKDRELSLKREEMAELHLELQEAEALLGLVGLGGEESELERACQDKDARIQALELQVWRLRGQVVSQELELEELRQSKSAPPPSTDVDQDPQSKRLAEDRGLNTNDRDTDDEILASLSRQSFLRSSTTSSSDVLLDNMSEYSQEYHLTDQAIADMIDSLGSPSKKTNVNGVRSLRRGESAYSKVRLSSGSFKKSGSKDANRGKDGASKKRRWI